MSQLGCRIHVAKSKISELMSGRMYPHWGILYSLAAELQIPHSPLFRLWKEGALEANKPRTWFTQPAGRAGVKTELAAPPLEHSAFRDHAEAGYLAYAGAFLTGHCRDNAVLHTFDQLWLTWPEALSSRDVRSYAWSVLRATVMSRTPHVDGRPTLLEAAFDTVAIATATDVDEAATYLQETQTLFHAMRGLPDQQYDVIVLTWLCGMPEAECADLLGVPRATVRSSALHAERYLDTVMYPPDTEEEAT
jgi:transcriptional regulator with XRE-family HTH domain